MNTDMIIPLASRRNNEDDELRILLRSIERNCTGVGRVIVVTDNAPRWLVNAVVVNAGDTNHFNKDANLISKTIKAIRECDIEQFVWCADDNVFMSKVELSSIPNIHNRRTRNDFYNGNRWMNRVLNTLNYFERKGTPLSHNYESHCPQFFSNAQRLADVVEKIDYQELPGYTIMTLFRGVMNELDSELQDDFKETAQEIGDVAKLRFDRMFLGYNDICFIHENLKDVLFGMFHEKSSFEK